MPVILVVERTGTIQALSVKKYEEDLLFKKAGFKTPADFGLHHTFDVTLDDSQQTYHVGLYGKTSGRANTENKYDFPPPVDNVLFFGNCLLVNKDATGAPLDISVKEWTAIYEHLFGGFEDLGNETEDDGDDEMDEEEARIMNDPKTQFTKEGYVKDDFIVDDSDLDLEDEDYEEPKPKLKAKPKATLRTKKPETPAVPKEKRVPKAPAKPRGKRGGKVAPEGSADKTQENTVLEYQDELDEEAYFA